MRKRLTFIDYAIIGLVICSIAFVFIHHTIGDSTYESTSFDSSTLNKISEKYLSYYREGLIVNTTINGYNSTTREAVTLTGNIEWIDSDNGNNLKALINSNGNDYIVGLYSQVPEADVYIDTMTLEVNGDKYQDMVEIKANPKNVNSLNDLTSGISNKTDFEITTVLSIDSLETITVQKITNILFQNHGRISLKTSSVINQLHITRGTTNEFSEVNDILGNFNGITSEITIRIYNSTDDDIEYIKNNFDVKSISKF